MIRSINKLFEVNNNVDEGAGLIQCRQILKMDPSRMSIPGGSRLPCHYQCTIQLPHSDLNNVDEGAGLIQCRQILKMDLLGCLYLEGQDCHAITSVPTIQLLHSDLNNSDLHNVDEGADLIQCRQILKIDIS